MVDNSTFGINNVDDDNLRGARPRWTRTQQVIAGSAAAATVLALVAAYKLSRSTSHTPKPADPKDIPITSETDAQRLAREERERVAADPSKRVSLITETQYLLPNEWILSPNRRSWMMQNGNGGWTIYMGSSPADTKSVVKYTTGNRNVKDGKCFSGISPDGYFYTKRGTPSSPGEILWQSGTKVSSNENRGTLILSLSDEGQLSLTGTNTPTVSIWMSPITTSRMFANQTLSVGQWIQSDNGNWFAIQRDTAGVEVWEGNNPDILPEYRQFKSSTLRDPRPKSDKYWSVLQIDRHFCTYKGDVHKPGEFIYGSETNSAGVINPVLHLTDEGQLVIEADNRPPVAISSRSVAAVVIPSNAPNTRLSKAQNEHVHRAVDPREHQLPKAPLLPPFATNHGRSRGPALTPIQADRSLAAARQARISSTASALQPTGLTPAQMSIKQ
jgi:hypothetical protein